MTSPPSHTEGSGAPPTEVTELLHAWRAGDADAGERLMQALYRELHDMARRRMGRERQDATLQTTALVHEAYLRLIDQKSVDWKDRGHFLALAATMMRRVLVDRARARHAEKRGAGEERIALTEIGDVGQLSAIAATSGRSDAVAEVLDIDRALDKLSREFPRPARVVELRFFGGLEFEEIGAVLDLTERTARRDWVFARAWLERELRDWQPKNG